MDHFVYFRVGAIPVGVTPILRGVVSLDSSPSEFCSVPLIYRPEIVCCLIRLDEIIY